MDIAKKKRSTAETCFMGEFSFAASNSALRGKGRTRFRKDYRVSWRKNSEQVDSP